MSVSYITDPNSLPVGTPVAVPIWVVGIRFTHLGVIYREGTWYDEPMVISNSRRRGMVVVEPWSAFTAGHRAWIPALVPGVEAHETIARADRDLALGTVWTVFENCEHAVRRWLGLPVESPQLQSWVAGTGVTMAVVVPVLGLFLSDRR